MNKKQRFTYANIIIAVCLSVSLVVTASVVWEYHRLNTVMPSGVLTAILGLWGGELLILALRQVLGSDIVHKRKQTSTEYDEDGRI